jgi:hypothetical protein
MKAIMICAWTACLAILFTACSSNKEDNAGTTIITEKIEYPVFIKSPYEEEQGDWWKENIETSKRTDFAQLLMDWAYSGKVAAYDFVTNQALTVEQVKLIGNETDTILVTEKFPPYDEKDTVIQQKLDIRLIHKVKFLEEWSYNLDDHSISKKVIGIAPTLTIYDDSVDIKGYRPLFWLYFDKEYAKSLNNK